MKVFVTGATGYIGGAVAAAFARAGHRVFGLVRSEEKAKSLARREIWPIVGTLRDDQVLQEAARTCQVLVHTALDPSAAWEADQAAIHSLLEGARTSGRPRLFIYTSGVWVYGDTAGQLVDEACPLNPVPFAQPRLGHECQVLEAAKDKIRTLVLRPGCVYGGRGGLTGAWFESSLESGAARIVGDGAFRWSMVHIADLAQAYVLAGESSYSGQIFNVTDRSRFTVRECAIAANRAAGGEGKVESMPLEDAIKNMGPWAAGLALDQHIDSSQAVRYLGWTPRHGGFVDGADRYFAAWKALRGER